MFKQYKCQRNMFDNFAGMYLINIICDRIHVGDYNLFLDLEKLLNYFRYIRSVL